MTRFSAPLALCLALCSVVSAQTNIDFLSESANATESGCTGTDFLSTMCLETIDHHPMGVLLEIFLFVMAFLALAIVCDDYLVLSLETLCVRWSIRDDIAGCTFMAFGSAAPEIIVNAVATIKSGDGGSSAEGSTDQGISAILGSGMIAFMLIPGFCGIFGGKDKPLQLKRRPLLRDVTAYSIGLVEVCVFFRDHYISTAEALIMLLTYASYILVVVFSPRIRKALRRGSKGEMIPLLEEDASARTVRGLNVRFFCKGGDSIDFPAEGPLLTRNGEAVPATEAGLKFLLSSEFQIQYPDSEKVMQTIVLAHQGCERIVARVERLMQSREIPTEKAWVVGTNVSAFCDGQWADATVVAEEDGAYSVRRASNDSNDSAVLNNGLPFSDVRPLRDADDSLPSMAPESQSEVIGKRKEILKQAADLGAISVDIYNKSMESLTVRHGGIQDSEESESEAPTNCTALSQWRRHWWREASVAGMQNEGPAWLKYLRPLGVFVSFWQVVFKYTIPAHEIDDEEQSLEGEGAEEVPEWRKKIYPVTFLVSFLWVAVFSFLISNIAGRWATLSGLGQGFMGLLLISVGAEIPDCIQSVTVAKRGYGSMAVSNAIGSQNVNVFIGLGLPWLISNLAGTKIFVNDVDDLRAAAYFDVGGVALNVCMLLVSAIYLGLNKATLGFRKGTYLVGAYFSVMVAYATYSTIQKH